MPSRKAHDRGSTATAAQTDAHEVDLPDALTQAMQAWEALDDGHEPAIAVARQIYDSSKRSTRQFGWAALTLARAAGMRHVIDQTERYLTEAIGSFVYSGDVYGRVIAEAHLAMPAIVEHRLTVAMRHAQSPWSCGIALNGVDSRRLHVLLAYVHWRLDDPKTALLHCVQALDSADKAGSVNERVRLLANVSALLIDLCQFKLAADACEGALRIAEGVLPNERLTAVFANGMMSNILHGNLRTAGFYLERFETIKVETPAPFTVQVAACWYQAHIGAFDKASRYLDLLRHSDELANPIMRATLLITEAELCALAGEYPKAIGLSQEVLKTSVADVKRCSHRIAANCLSRCYAALGKSAESTRWKRYAMELTPSDVLDKIFSSQIEASVKRDVPNPLTPQELECLSLSARGQTSADIALKLGIKPRTVNFHISKVLRKLNAMNRHEAIAKAISANYLRL